MDPATEAVLEVGRQMVVTEILVEMALAGTEMAIVDPVVADMEMARAALLAAIENRSKQEIVALGEEIATDTVVTEGMTTTNESGITTIPGTMIHGKGEDISSKSVTVCWWVSSSTLVCS